MMIVHGDRKRVEDVCSSHGLELIVLIEAYLAAPRPVLSPLPRPLFSVHYGQSK
ncbi:MAG: hypothetical protein AAF959_03210 [Cyanobacteria bacterium P01_D01_bin.56]